MINKKTLTIGIAAYNEERNISNVLQSLLKQVAHSYGLERIYVVSDGSSDKTDAKVLALSQKYPVIRLLADHKRKGKSERLNEIYKKNTSDIVFVCDADVVMQGNNVLEKIVHAFDNKDVVLVSCKKVPVKPENFVEALICWWSELFDRIMFAYKEGQHVYTTRSCAYALEKKFSKTVYHEKSMVTHAQFIYFLAMKAKKIYVALPDAAVLVRVPATLAEYYSFYFRTTTQKKKLIKYFGAWILPYYEFPKKIKIKEALKFFVIHPIQSILTISFHIVFTKLPHKEDPNIKKGYWKVITTSKRAIRLH